MYVRLHYYIYIYISIPPSHHLIPVSLPLTLTREPKLWLTLKLRLALTHTPLFPSSSDGVPAFLPIPRRERRDPR